MVAAGLVKIPAGSHQCRTKGINVDFRSNKFNAANRMFAIPTQALAIVWKVAGICTQSGTVIHRSFIVHPCLRLVLRACASRPRAQCYCHLDEARQGTQERLLLLCTIGSEQLWHVCGSLTAA
jgi:hypothetical protein